MKIARLHVLPFAAALFFTITQPSCTREAKKERSLEAALKHFDQGAFSAAEIEYKNALQADPGNPEAIKHLGIIRALQGSSYEAAGILTQARTMLPKDNEVAINLAKSLLTLGFLPDSRKELFEVLDRSPDNGEALLFLAESSIRPEWMEECDQRIKAAGKKSAASKLAPSTDWSSRAKSNAPGFCLKNSTSLAIDEVGSAFCLMEAPGNAAAKSANSVLPIHPG